MLMNTNNEKSCYTFFEFFRTKNTLQKISSFPLRISLIDVTKEITFTEEILNEKLHFLCSDRIKADALNFQNVPSFPVELHAVVSTSIRRVYDICDVVKTYHRRWNKIVCLLGCIVLCMLLNFCQIPGSCSYKLFL